MFEKIRQSFRRHARSGYRFDRAGHLGLRFASFGFVRHFDRLRYFRLVDFLRAGDLVGFRFPQKIPDAERPYKAFGYPVVPILFLLVGGLAFDKHDDYHAVSVFYRNFLDFARITSLLLFDER